MLHVASRRLAVRALTVALALQLGGCASLPQPVAERTGEALSVREKTETGHVTEKVKVGEVEHKDSSGRTIGKSEVFQDQTRSFEYRTWAAYQGDQVISDDDLYRIANDKAAAEEVKSSRESGVTMEYVGAALLAAGIGGLVGGYVVSAKQDPESPSSAPTYIIGGSGVVAAVGGILTYVGISKVKREHPLDQSRAQGAAIRYNRALGSGPRVTQTTGAQR